MSKYHEKYMYSLKTQPGCPEKTQLACPEKADSGAEDEERERQSKARCYGTEW